MTDLRKAAEMALEVLKTYDGKWLEDGRKVFVEPEIKELEQALAQPEREYMDVVVAEHKDGTRTTQRIPLSKREWVGLTDEEIRDLWFWSTTKEAEQIANTQQHAFAKAIEIKLKEKNT